MLSIVATSLVRSRLPGFFQKSNCKRFSSQRASYLCTTRDRASANCSASGSGTRGASSLFLLLLDELALDHDLDLVADDPPAIEHHVERHAEVLAVNLALGAVADAVA